MTGKELVAMIEARARELGLHPLAFAAPLNPKSTKAWLRQVRAASKPKQHTIDRVKALIEGREVPPPPANNFQASPRSASAYISCERGPKFTAPEPVNRDPCFWCGVRADIGCRHQGAAA